MVRRLKVQYCKVIVLTSLVWVLFDVCLLTYYTDCMISSQSQSGCSGYHDRKSAGHAATGEKPGFFVMKARKVDAPGEMGKPVVLPDSQKHMMKEKFKINQFNLMASDIISSNRSLADIRMDACKHKSYPSIDLPTTSIVIVFHNEAWSTLVRTIWSVINRSPKHLLQEIILVDDASERDFLGKKLEEYVSKLPVSVRVERMGERSGLIRARLHGAERAKGKVITFLDAHCECTKGWLEPLLFEIYKDRTSVVCPIIDVISDESFEYITGSDMTWGGFNWKLNFRWYPVPQREVERRSGDRSLPLRTPTMAGGLFAIDRDYFYELGSYDPGMDIWGGENLEMSFRIWMCGGTLLIVTCSHVGHVFRKATPYTFPGGTGKIINHNNARLAEVWMDEWRDFYYKISPGLHQTDVGDLTERRNLRDRLKCRTFRWYLENIYPESQMPLDYYSLGEVRNKETGQCLDTMGRKASEKVGMVSCHGMGGNQVFSYTKKKSFQNDDLCLDVSALSGPVKLYQCHGLGGNQLWEYNKQALTIVHMSSNQCLDKPGPTADKDSPSVGQCNGNLSQQWILGDLDWKRSDH